MCKILLWFYQSALNCSNGNFYEIWNILGKVSAGWTPDLGIQGKYEKFMMTFTTDSLIV